MRVSIFPEGPGDTDFQYPITVSILSWHPTRLKMDNNMKKYKIFLIILILKVVLFLCHETCFAEITSSGVMDSILEKYHTAAQSWGTTIKEHATNLFFYLVAISMVWQFAQLLFHRSSYSELFGEIIRFLTFSGFFLWLLRNGPENASAIITSLIKRRFKQWRK